MKINSGEIILHDNASKTWLYFKSLRGIITTNQALEIQGCLRQIEGLVERNNWYAAGFLSYESAPAFDSALRVKPCENFPLLWFGLYEKPEPVSLPGPTKPVSPIQWSPSVSRAEYDSAIAAIKDYIARGRTYQVNYTIRLKASFTEDPWPIFLAMVQAQGNGYSAYVDIGTHVIASASPELFFAQDGETLTCRPMKGTVKRGRTNEEDSEQATWLEASEKNRAENVMIVDMIRNDLGRIAETGSVHVPKLFTTERYPTLWQMTSTVTARSTAPLTEILRALFPCGSITGAPKISTMNIINELENSPRKIYTGSIGFVAPERQAQFNVAIRTLLIDKTTGDVEYGTGGGIVWDSISENEYEEALLKAKVLTVPSSDFQLLETLRWSPGEGYYLLNEHIDRMMDSAFYFGFHISREAIESHLRNLGTSFPEQPQRVRLLLSKDSTLSSEFMTLLDSQESHVRLRLAEPPIKSDNVFLFHKTTRRDVYERALASTTDCDDVLLCNERGELTESTMANLVVELNGELLTPSLDCGLLAGTLRGHLLKTGKIKESIIMKSQLGECRKFYLVNSVRGWREAIFLRQ